MIDQNRLKSGKFGRTFVHQRRRAVGQRAVDDVAVARDPADVGGAPVDILIVQIEDVFGGDIRPDHVAAGGVDDSLGLAGRSAGVEDEKRVLGVHRLGGALRRLGRRSRRSTRHRGLRPSRFFRRCV